MTDGNDSSGKSDEDLARELLESMDSVTQNEMASILEAIIKKNPGRRHLISVPPPKPKKPD